MSTSSATGTPVLPTPGGSVNTSIEALPYTKMPLFDFARRLGLNPIHFAGAMMSGRFVDEQTCSVPWPRYSWQNESLLSHMDLALALQQAEAVIENHLGYHVAPDWRTEEHQYPRYQRVWQTNAVDTTGRRPALQMHRGHIIDAGVRKQDFLGSYPVVWQDLDGDGFSETAYVAVPDVTFDVKEIALFPYELGVHPSWQIRYPRQYITSGTTVSFLIDFWHMIDPEQLALLPDPNRTIIDLSLAGNRITTIDAYRIYNDDTDTACVTYTWEPSPLNESAGKTTAAGLAWVRDGEAGLVAPYWPSGMGANFSPDKVRITYYSGMVSEDYTNGRTLNPLGGQLADAVFFLAAARLTRDVCGCASAKAYAEDLQTDMSLVSPAGNFLAVADEIQTCPFGTRRGEWLAYKNIKLLDRHIEVAVI